MRQLPTSPFTPDLEQVRTWLEEMVAAMKFVELVLAIVGLVGRMRDINLELTKRVAHLTQKRPRSEALDRLEKQLVLPLAGLVVPTVKSTTPASSALPARQGKRRHGGGGRGAFPSYIPRVEVKNLVPPDLRVPARAPRVVSSRARRVA